MFLGMFLLIGVLFLAGCGSSVDDKTVAATYQNSRLLVSESELVGNLSAANQVIVDVRSAAVYATGHIPGAINLTVSSGGQFDIGTGGNGITNTDLKPAATIATILGAAGVANSAKIVLYGQNVDASTGRMFWMLEYLGAADVRVLDGGYDKWVKDGRTTATAATTLATATFTPALVSSRLATKADVLAHYTDLATYAIVDSRDATDLTGTKTGANLAYDAKHIPNAINILTGDFLNTDNTVKSYSDLKAFLDGKGITAGKTVITHCYVGYRSAQEYFIFRLMGYNVSNYDGSWAEWNADPTLPTASHNVLLTPGTWLAANLTSANQVIIDVRDSATYAKGHIPGSINLAVTPGAGLFDIGGTGINNTDLQPVAMIAATLGAAGVSNTTRIIVYGQNVDMLPGRMFWMLEYLGDGDVHLLDGGYDKWVADGRATSTTATPPLAAATFTPAVVTSRLALKADVLAHYADTATYGVVDSRNASDFTTKHIPSAINILTGDFLNSDNTVKSYNDIKAWLDGKGITVGKTVITNCYVGYRSSQEYFIFRLMGFNVSNYDGSWTEWSADPTLPTAP